MRRGSAFYPSAYLLAMLTGTVAAPSAADEAISLPEKSQAAQPDAGQVVYGYMLAIGRRDIVGARIRWDKSSPEYPAWLAAARVRIKSGNYSFPSGLIIAPGIPYVDRNGREVVTVRVSGPVQYDWNKNGASIAATSLPDPKVFTLVNRAGWKIESYVTEPDRMSAELLKTATAAQARELVQRDVPAASRPGFGRMLLSLASAAYDRNDYKRSRRAYFASIVTLGMTTDECGYRNALIGLADARRSSGDLALAASTYREYLRTQRAAMMKCSCAPEECRCMSEPYARASLSYCLQELGQSSEATAEMKKALPAYAHAGRAGIPASLDVQYARMIAGGAPQHAKIYLTKAIRRAAGAGNEADLANARRAGADLDLGTNDFIGARGAYQWCQSWYESVADRAAATDCITGIAQVSANQGDWAEALAYARRALLSLRYSGRHGASARCAHVVSYCLAAQGSLISARSAAAEELREARLARDPVAIARALLDEQNAGGRPEWSDRDFPYGSFMGDFQCAGPSLVATSVATSRQSDRFLRAMYEWVSASTEQPGARIWSAALMLNRARQALGSGDPRQSRSYAASAARLAAQANCPEIRWRSLVLSGRSRSRLGDHAGAVEDYRRAIDIIEAQRGRVAGDDHLRVRCFASKAEIYKQIAIEDVALGRNDEALSYADAATGRILLDSLIRLRSSRETLQTGEARIGGFERIDVGERKDASQRAPIIEYCWTDNAVIGFAVLPDAARQSGSKILAWRVDQQKLRAEMNGLFYWDDGAQAHLSRIWELLLPPDAQTAALKARRLIVVPDGLLWGVPFQALVVRSGNPDVRYLADFCAVSYEWSVRWMMHEERDRNLHDPQPLQFLGMLNLHSPSRANEATSLPMTKAEVQLGKTYLEATRRLFPAPRLKFVGDDATVSRLLQQAGRARVAYIECHGTPDLNDPLKFSLGFPTHEKSEASLTIARLATSRLNADLAILACCSSGTGHVTPGEGLIGPVWALSLAGCRSVVVTQWPVDIDTIHPVTRPLLRMIAKQCSGRPAGISKAEALRLAMVSAIPTDRRSVSAAPRRWAPWILVGDPGRMEQARGAVKPQRRPYATTVAQHPPDININFHAYTGRPWSSMDRPNLRGAYRGDLVSMSVFLQNTGVSTGRGTRVRVRLGQGLSYVPNSTTVYTVENSRDVQYSVPDTKLGIKGGDLSWAWFDLAPSSRSSIYINFMTSVSDRTRLGEDLTASASCSFGGRQLTRECPITLRAMGRRPGVDPNLQLSEENSSIAGRYTQRYGGADDLTPASPGDRIHYVATLTNDGREKGIIYLRVKLPPGLKFVGSATVTPSRFSGYRWIRGRPTNAFGPERLATGYAIRLPDTGNTHVVEVEFSAEVSHGSRPASPVIRECSASVSVQGGIRAVARDVAVTCVLPWRGLWALEQFNAPDNPIAERTSDSIAWPDSEAQVDSWDRLDYRLFILNNTRKYSSGLSWKLRLPPQADYVMGSLYQRDEPFVRGNSLQALARGFSLTDIPPGNSEPYRFAIAFNRNTLALNQPAEHIAFVSNELGAPVWTHARRFRIVRR